MKMLYIVRHAKAGDHSPSHDFERVLTEQGKADAKQMGKVLKKRSVTPGLILASPAARTMATAIIIGQELEYGNVVSDDRRLYNAGEEKILKVIRETDNAVGSVMVVGHNPGITEFSNIIFNTTLMSLPTSGITGGQLEIESWKELRAGCGEQEFFAEPD